MEPRCEACLKVGCHGMRPEEDMSDHTVGLGPSHVAFLLLDIIRAAPSMAWQAGRAALISSGTLKTSIESLCVPRFALALVSVSVPLGLEFGGEAMRRGCSARFRTVISATLLVVLVALPGASCLHWEGKGARVLSLLDGTGLCGRARWKGGGIPAIILHRVRGGQGEVADDEDERSSEIVKEEETGEALGSGSEGEIKGNGYRAAFGIVVGSEAAAGTVNLAITAGMAVAMTLSRKHLKESLDGSTVLTSPRVLDAVIYILYASVALQIPMCMWLLNRHILPFAGARNSMVAMYQDTFGPTDENATPKQRAARLRRQLQILRYIRIGSIIVILAVMLKTQDRKGKGTTQDAAEVGEGEGAVVAGSELATGISAVFTGLFSETVGVVKDIIGEVKAFISKIENDGVAVDGVGKNSKENAVDKIESPAETKDGSQRATIAPHNSTVNRFFSLFIGDGDIALAHMTPQLRQSDDERNQEPEMQLRGGSEESVKGDEILADGNKSEGSINGKAIKKVKKSQDLMDMIPSKLQPLAFGGMLVGFLYTLLKAVLDVGETRWIRMKKYKCGVLLQSNPQARGDQFSAFVATAFEDMGMRRNHYFPILSACLGAVGSAQGVIRFFSDGKESDQPKTLWICSPIARWISQINGHVVWMGLSFFLGAIGQYDKSAIMFLDRPKEWTVWRQRGMVRGRVSAQTVKNNYTLSVVINMEDGSKMQRSHVFNMTQYESQKEGAKDVIFQAHRFAEDVQSKLVLELPWLGQGNGRISAGNNYLADGYTPETDREEDDGAEPDSSHAMSDCEHMNEREDEEGEEEEGDSEEEENEQEQN